MEILKTQQWQGSKGAFEIMRTNGELVKGTLYFVGNSSSTERAGLDGSTEGIIYYASSPTTTVRFGWFSDEDVGRVFDATFDATFGNTSHEQEIALLREEINTLKEEIIELNSKINSINADLDG